MDRPSEAESGGPSTASDAAPRSKDDNGDLKDLAALASAMLGVFTALAGGATVGGGLDRISRDYPAQVAIALFSFTVATVLAAWSTLLGRAKRSQAPEIASRRAPQRLIRSAVALFVAGLAFSFWAMLGTAGSRSRPSMNVVVREGDRGETVLEAEIRASGLSSHEYVRIKVMPVAGATVLHDEPPIYLSTQGPRVSGEVDVRFSLPLRPGRFDGLLIKVWQTDKEPPCPLDRIGQRGTSGCLTLSVPQMR